MKNEMTRRDFLSSTGKLTGGLILGFYLPHSSSLVYAAETAVAINAWLRVGTDNKVTVFVAHSEMGQGVYTSLPMLIAEELEVDWNNIKVEMSPTGGEDYKNPLIGQQLTGGSTSIRGRWESLRQAGASAREMLIHAAAKQWQVNPQECQAKEGQVIHRSGKTLTYGQLAQVAAQLPPPAAPPLKSPKQFKIIGQALKRLETPEKVEGRALYGIDVQVPNMLYATVQQSPVFGAKVEAYDAEVAEAFKAIPMANGMAVVADSYWKAKQGLEALRVRFSATEVDKQDSGWVTQQFQQGLTEKGVEAYQRGDVEGALKKAKKILEAEYSVPFLAHLTMEPMNCVADVRKDRCEIWVGTQAQEKTRDIASEITGLPKEKVIVHTLYLGGGFGRRSEVDFVEQAVYLSKTVGQPVKVIWSREEDVQHDFYRPAAMAKLVAGLDEKGKPIAMRTRLVSSSILMRVAPPLMKGELDPIAMEGFTPLEYDIPHQYAEYVMKNTHVPVGFWRSVGHSYSAFFVESFIDEIAQAGSLDPYMLRRELLGQQPNFLRVLETLAEKSAWGKTASTGHYQGLAIHQSFGSIVGEVAEVSVSREGEVKVHKVVCVVHCGMVINPNLLKAQVEGSVAYGLSSLTEAITLKNGQVEQSNWSDYPVLRMANMPEVEVHLLSSEEKPGGMGEPATPPIVPAVTNAIFAATGKRIRSLPLTSDQLRQS